MDHPLPPLYRYRATDTCERTRTQWSVNRKQSGGERQRDMRVCPKNSVFEEILLCSLTLKDIWTRGGRSVGSGSEEGRVISTLTHLL